MQLLKIYIAITFKMKIGIENKGFLSGITGAVTGVLGTPVGIGVLTFVVALVAIYIYAVVMRKRAGK